MNGYLRWSIWGVDINLTNLFPLFDLNWIICETRWPSWFPSGHHSKFFHEFALETNRVADLWGLGQKEWDHSWLSMHLVKMTEVLSSNAGLLFHHCKQCLSLQVFRVLADSSSIFNKRAHIADVNWMTVVFNGYKNFLKLIIKWANTVHQLWLVTVSCFI